jgi:putative ABC transport system permease protein
MNWNYLKIAWRILAKNKVHTIINIIGLGVGLSVSVLMMIYVHHQLSFDNFHRNGDRIYRFTIEGVVGDGRTVTGAITSGDVARVVTDDVPELEHTCRIYNWGANEVIINDKRFTDDQVLWVDSSFFQIFTFPLLKGNPVLALKEPATLVLTQKTAIKYFGDTDPVNQTLRLGGNDYLITGVAANPPSNSHLQFDILASFHTLERPDWDVVKQNGLSFPTYVLVKEGVDHVHFTEKAVASADISTNERFNPYGIVISHYLQPLTRIHLHSAFSFDMAKRGDIRNVYVFSFLALGVILIALFNFVNLVTAQSEKRTREIGMRKVMGAFRKDLVIQFIGESVLIVMFAFVLSLMLNELLIGEFSNLLDEKFRLEYWHNPKMLFSIIGFALVTGVLAGFYPAFYLSRFQPVSVLKGATRTPGGTSLLRKVLVIFQFAISIFLIVSVLLLNQQVRYMKYKDLGFDRENVVAVRKLTNTLRTSYPTLKAELMQHPGVVSVTGSQSVPGEDRSLQNSYKKGDDPRAAVMMFENRVQHGYLETFGLRLVDGRDFDPEMRTDTASIIINRAAARKLGLDNPVGEEIYVWQHLGRIIGVVEDYNYLSLHNEIDPLALTMYSDWITRISIRILPGNTQETLAWIQDKFESTDPNYTFDHSFVDESFARMYEKEERVNKLITAAAILAIIISFMGLYALTSFTISKKVKEIGIRKTLGASVENIVGLLFRDLSRWVIFGNIIAWPLAWYVVTRWQENFAFRINIVEYIHLFVIAGLMAAFVGAMATLVQAVSAANANPVDSLRAE